MLRIRPTRLIRDSGAEGRSLSPSVIRRTHGREPCYAREGSPTGRRRRPAVDRAGFAVSAMSSRKVGPLQIVTPGERRFRFRTERECEEPRTVAREPGSRAEGSPYSNPATPMEGLRLRASPRPMIEVRLSCNGLTPDTHVRKLGTQHPDSDVCRCMALCRRAALGSSPFQPIREGARSH